MFLIGCKGDDLDTIILETEEIEDPNDEVNSLPSVFVVGIEVLNFYSATITWEEATSTLPSPIVYDLYLNDALIADSLTERVYELEVLQELTNYTLKINAKNEIGETPITTEFSTPEANEIRLIKIVTESNPNAVLVNNFVYNQGGKILESETVVDWTNPGSPDWDFTHYKYTYINDKLIHGTASFNWYAGIGLSSSIYYTYSDDLLIKLQQYENYDGYVTRRIHTFTSPTSYDFIREKFNMMGVYETRHREVDIVFNTNGELLEYHQNNIEEGTSGTVLFQYENGNLIKVTNGSIVLEVSYDNSNNFLTYSNNGFSPLDGSSVFQTSGFFNINITIWPFSLMRRIPHFLTYKNQNNPIEYKLNGEVIQSFQYEYNPYGYPSKIQFTNSGGALTELTLSYEEID